MATDANSDAPAPPRAARFSIAVRFLNGWAMATHPTDRKRAEWPPHPDRLFMVLVAAAGDETEFDDALRYIERRPPPELRASDAEQREVVTSYVPVNDPEITRKKKPESPQTRYASLASLDKAKEAGLALLPEHRTRQPRTFPVAIPRDPTVHFLYELDDAFTPGLREKLAVLCTRVTRVGHSASLVQCWLDFDPPPANLVPSEGAAPQRLRVPSAGRLEILRGLYELNLQQGADLRPTPGLWAGYAPPRHTPTDAGVACTVFDPTFLLLRPAQDEGRRPPLVATLRLAEALRGLLMNATRPEDLPEALGGHAPDGTRLERPHLAIAPLPFVGHEHADGRIMGMALMLPRERAEEPHSAEDAAAIGQALNRKLYGDDGFDPQPLTLTLGSAGTWTLTASDDFRQASLKPEVWTADSSDSERRGARIWATVTPIVLDRHPKHRNGASIAAQTEGILGDACANVGLPRPVAVEFGPASMFRGVPHVRDFPPLRRKNGSAPNYTHAMLMFDKPVIGPVLLGAGRYRGYGLCRPLTGAGGTA